MSFFPRYDGRYKKSHLRKLHGLIHAAPPRGYPEYKRLITNFLRESKFHPVVVWSTLFDKAHNDEAFSWAEPLWLVMYEWDLERMPEVITRPIYGVVAQWRLELGI